MLESVKRNVILDLGLRIRVFLLIFNSWCNYCNYSGGHYQCAGYKLLTTLTYSFFGKKIDWIRWYCFDSILSFHFLSGRLRFAPLENGVRESHSLCLEFQCERKLNKQKVVTGRGRGEARGCGTRPQACRSAGTRSGRAWEGRTSCHRGKRGEIHCLRL